MEVAAQQSTASQILRAIQQDQVYLFLGSAFITVGLVAAAFSLLRRRLNPLLLWLALFAILYGSRMWLQTALVRLSMPDTGLLRAIEAAMNYAIPIPAAFFFEAGGFLGRWGKVSVYAFTAVFLALLIGVLAVGPLHIFELTNHIAIIGAFLALTARSMARRAATGDFTVLRRGLMVFVAFVLYDNVVGAFFHPSGAEPYGFAVFLGCLGYVAARQTLEREAQLGDIQKELEVARRMQVSILPGNFPSSANFRVAARFQPMTSVAGDFYDFLVADDRQAGILIADVSGHGVPAALIASMVKMAATAQRAAAADPAALMSGMNAALCGNTQQQFVTAAYVHLDAEAGELRYSAAGHPPMLLLRGGQVAEVEENGLILAAFSSSAYSNAVRGLEHGDRIALYTDGIVEAANAGQEEFGRDRLGALLLECSALSHTETADRIISAVEGWAVAQEDDLTVLVCDYRRSAPAENSLAAGRR